MRSLVIRNHGDTGRDHATITDTPATDLTVDQDTDTGAGADPETEDAAGAGQDQERGDGGVDQSLVRDTEVRD